MGGFKGLEKQAVDLKQARAYLESLEHRMGRVTVNNEVKHQMRHELHAPFIHSLKQQRDNQRVSSCRVSPEVLSRDQDAG